MLGQLSESIVAATGAAALVGAVVILITKYVFAKVTSHIDDRGIHVDPSDPPLKKSLLEERHREMKNKIDVLHHLVDAVKHELKTDLEKAEQRIIQAIDKKSA